jgi:hypothetical protein
MRFNTSILLSLLALETLAAPAPQADVSDVVISAPASASTAATTGVKGGCKAKIGGSLFGVNRGHRRPHSRPSGNADAPAPSGDAEPATPAPSSGSEVPADIPSPSPSAEETPAPSPSPVESDIPMPSDQAPAPAPAAESTATEVQHVNEGVTVIIGDARPTQDTAPNVSAPNPVQSEQAPPPAQSPAPAAPASGGSGSDDGNGSSFDGFAEAMLKGHNDYRASYNGESSSDDTLREADPARSRRFGLEPEYRGPRNESLQGQKLRDGAFVGPRLGEVVRYSPVTVTWMGLVRTCELGTGTML